MQGRWAAASEPARKAARVMTDAVRDARLAHARERMVSRQKIGQAAFGCMCPRAWSRVYVAGADERGLIYNVRDYDFAAPAAPCDCRRDEDSE